MKTLLPGYQNQFFNTTQQNRYKKQQQKLITHQHNDEIHFAARPRGYSPNRTHWHDGQGMKFRYNSESGTISHGRPEREMPQAYRAPVPVTRSNSLGGGGTSKRRTASASSRYSLHDGHRERDIGPSTSRAFEDVTHDRPRGRSDHRTLPDGRTQSPRGQIYSNGQVEMRPSGLQSSDGRHLYTNLQDNSLYISGRKGMRLAYSHAGTHQNRPLYQSGEDIIHFPRHSTAPEILLRNLGSNFYENTRTGNIETQGTNGPIVYQNIGVPFLATSTRYQSPGGTPYKWDQANGGLVRAKTEHQRTVNRMRTAVAMDEAYTKGKERRKGYATTGLKESERDVRMHGRHVRDYTKVVTGGMWTGFTNLFRKEGKKKKIDVTADLLDQFNNHTIERDERGWARDKRRRSGGK